METQFLAGMLLGQAVEFGGDDAGLGDHAARMDRLDLVHVEKVEDDAAGERHGLAVIARAAAARRDRHAMGIGDLQRADHFLFALRRNDEVTDDVVELGLQDRRVPIEVTALLLHERRIVLNRDALEFLLDLLVVRHGQSFISGSRSR
ncbi:hypothetical protein D3C72_1806480 [compost metagenome]